MSSMATRQYRPSPFRRLALPAVAAVFLGYFTYHAFHGEYGIAGRAQTESRATQLRAELDRLKRERTEMEKRVSMLSGKTLDQDLLDLHARDALNFVDPNDLVILRPKAK
ncbi:Septum formation initiator [Hartmannibacter diazotrophicus]|uniref:Septum formation initiator n=1 Tax=Hartmannibacter diazotrophicus TaxID=1482074 RepID=A0A2C9D415_9HYPH|nr:septum formation initiator family protein [Hartmannibacter diazotrophicus]SON55077.1 Septum formation initiator [Hartmannibacter diazotrophicus]